MADELCEAAAVRKADAMTNRITRKIVTFSKPFQLTGMSASFPAGSYEVMTEEEPLGDVMFPAYRRMWTSIYLPRPNGQIGLGQIIEIDPIELDAVLQRSGSRTAD